jgi:hypothetical protein
MGRRPTRGGATEDKVGRGRSGRKPPCSGGRRWRTSVAGATVSVGWWTADSGRPAAVENSGGRVRGVPRKAAVGEDDGGGGGGHDDNDGGGSRTKKWPNAGGGGSLLLYIDHPPSPGSCNYVLIIQAFQS